LISLGDQQYALRTPGGQYVGAVSGQGAAASNTTQQSPLHIDATKADKDEFFTLVPAGEDVALQTADGVNYATAVGGAAVPDPTPFRFGRTPRQSVNRRSSGSSRSTAGTTYDSEVRHSESVRNAFQISTATTDVPNRGNLRASRSCGCCGSL
jgi:hypothetical protein